MAVEVVKVIKESEGDDEMSTARKEREGSTGNVSFFPIK